MKAWLPLLLAACIQEVKAPLAQVAAPTTPVLAGQLVTLDGSGSSDPAQLPLAYHWRVITAPAGSAAQVRGDGSAVAAFVPDAEGDFVLGLVVKNAIKPSEEARVPLTVTGACGTVGAQPPIKQGEPYQLPPVKNEMGCAGKVERQWEVATAPEASKARIEGDVFRPDLEGAYTLTYFLHIDEGPWLSARTLALTVEQCPITLTPTVNDIANETQPVLLEMGALSFSAVSTCMRTIVDKRIEVVSSTSPATNLKRALPDRLHFTSPQPGALTVSLTATDSAGFVSTRLHTFDFLPLQDFYRVETMGALAQSNNAPFLFFQDEALRSLRLIWVDTNTKTWKESVVLTGVAGELDNTVTTDMPASVALMNDNSPRVVFSLTDAASTRYYYGEQGPDGWRTLDLTSLGALALPAGTGPVELLVNPANVLLLFYLKADASLWFARCNSNCTTTGWMTPTPISGADNVASFDAAVGPNAEIAVVFQKTGAPAQADVVRCTSNCSAAAASSFATTPLALKNPAVTIAADGKLWLAYIEGAINDYDPATPPNVDAYVKVVQCTALTGAPCSIADRAAGKTVVHQTGSFVMGTDATSRLHLVLRSGDNNAGLRHVVSDAAGNFDARKPIFGSCSTNGTTVGNESSLAVAFAPSGDAHAYCGGHAGDTDSIRYYSPDRLWVNGSYP